MRRRRSVVFVTATVLLVPVVLGLRATWWRVCGNYPIAFYGRVIDERGTGVAGVKVTFDIRYSGHPAMPVMYGRGESKQQTTVTTDADGNFDVNGLYGYSIRGSAVQFRGKSVGLQAVNLTPDRDPGYGVMMDERWSRLKLPDTPAKRVSYRIVDLR